MNNCILILRAAETAARWHKNQRRKGADAAPYVGHLLEVATMAAEATGGADPTLIIGALLHDAVEDAGITPTMIAEQFGQDVADLVLEVSDDKGLPKAERKRLQVVNAPHKSARAKVIKLADKISNVRSVANTPPPWPAERRLGYVAWAREVVSAIGDVDPELQNTFAIEAARAETAAAQSG
jgi:(p)ppGpp synthase/HD superfamily hydrolase